jgi:subtilisin family serine protease
MASFSLYRIGFVLLAGLLVFGTAPAAHSQEPTPPGVIHLQARTFDPIHNDSVGGATVQAAQVNAAGLAYYLVQFNGPVEQTWARQVEALGGQMLGYVPENTHVVRMRPEGAINIALLPAVRWVGPYLPGYKLAPALQAQSADAGQDEEAEFYAVAFPGVATTALTSFLQAQGATIQESAQSDLGVLFLLRAPLRSVTAIAQHPDVSWIEPYIMPTVTNAAGRKIIGSEAVWQNFGYFGAGQIIAVSDSGLSVQGQLTTDFGNRLLRAFSPSEMNLASSACRTKTTFTDLNGHGTHVAGSVLGGGVRSGSNAAGHLYTSSHAGVAPEAQMVFMALNTDGSTGIQCIDLNGDFLAKGYNEGARISTNSWGANDNGGYGQLASLVDDYIWRHKDYLVLYAAGNAGPGPRTVGSPGTAKNVLTVGASENNRPDQGNQSDNPDTMTSFSSRGPTADGRIKPEVVAPGSWILSVKAAQAPAGSFWGPFNDDYAFMGGTSMATPLTAGGAALVREWLNKTRNIPNPSGALQKAVLVNGAVQLPGAEPFNNASGFGRVDLNNTLNAHYAIIDDHVQGLQSGQAVSYTVQVISTDAGLLLQTAGLSPRAETVQAAAATLHLDTTTIAAATSVLTDATTLSLEALPANRDARITTPLPTVAGGGKEGLAPLVNPVPLRSSDPPTTSVNSAGFQLGHRPGGQSVNTFLQQMVGGGDFEEPGWSLQWNQVWLGSGVPVRTSNPSLVIDGEYSVWLGGSPSDDAIWYPLAFPDVIDTSSPSHIEFLVDIFDQDPGFDQFCVALVDSSGYFIGPFAPDDPQCATEDGSYTYTHPFSAAELADLAGQTGYLVLYNEGDGAEPHLSAIVDNISLVIDFPDVTLESTPTAGPPGTTFVLTGKYNVPYGPVDICIQPCSQDSYIKTVYADDRGEIAAFVYSSATTPPGLYPLQTFNVGGRTAETAITITSGGDATLSVAPTTGAAGSAFTVTGSGFVPNDNQIAVTVNGQSLGTAGSNAEGELSFTINTQTNTPAATYTVQATDSAGNSATATFTVTQVDELAPTLVVTPTVGPPGSTFTFTGQNFTPSQPVTITLDGQAAGQIQADGEGGVQLTLETAPTITPGTYALVLQQGSKQASAQFQITGDGGGGGTQSGGGIYLTLVWTDPPAQSFAGKTLVNDLDLTVDGPGGRRFGNGGASADRTNTVEAIRLENPAAGTYVVTVQANSVNGTFGAQPFALVATTKQSFAANLNKVAIADPSQVGSVSGVVFVDENQNGLKETNEAALANVRLTLTKSNTGFVHETTSAADGSYQFVDVPTGMYLFAAELPAPYAPFATTLAVNAGSNPAANVVAQVKVYLPSVQR